MTIESKQWAVRAIDFSRYKREGKRERKKMEEEDQGNENREKNGGLWEGREVVTDLLMDSLCSWMCTIIWPFGVHLEKYHRGKYYRHTACKMFPIALCYSTCLKWVKACEVIVHWGCVWCITYPGEDWKQAFLARSLSIAFMSMKRKVINFNRNIHELLCWLYIGMYSCLSLVPRPRPAFHCY